MEFPHVTVGGDAVGGWIVDIHDGTNWGTYHPKAATTDEARQMAHDEHCAKFSVDMQAYHGAAEPAADSI